MDIFQAKNLQVMLMAFAIALVASQSADACTAFMMADGKQVLVGNNEDFNRHHTRVWFIPAKSGDYGRVYFGYEDWSPQGGMNDQGLFFDFFATKPLEVKSSKDKPKFKGPITDRMAATCATVEDVLAMFAKYHLGSMTRFQMFVADKSGDAAIVEGDHIIRKKGTCQVVTNFYHSRVKENRRPCEWYKPSCSQYKTAEAMLATNETASVALFRNILQATHRNTIYARTLYSNIYDLKNGLIYLYYMHNFNLHKVFDLKAELKKGPHYYKLPELFGRPLAYTRKAYKHRIPAFRISFPGHYVKIPPVNDEVLRVKCPFSSTPLFAVYVDEKPHDVELADINEKLLFFEFRKFGEQVKIVSSKATKLNDGSPANEALIEWTANKYWPVKTMALSTYRDKKVIVALVTAFHHPEIFREFLYTLTFK